MENVLYYSEDVVESKWEGKNKKKSKYNLGLVVRGSQDESSDSDSDSDESYEPLKKDHVRVEWHPSGDVKVVENKKIKLVDRSLIPGDVVRGLVNGQKSQSGYIASARIICMLKCLTSPILFFNVDSSNLKLLKKYHDLVYMDRWVGSVKRVDEKVTLKFPDGASCEITSSDDFEVLSDFKDMNDSNVKSHRTSTIEVYEYLTDFYKGQVLRGKMQAFQDATWIKSTVRHNAKTAKKNKKRVVTVEIVEMRVSAVCVEWTALGTSLLDDEFYSTTPPNLVKEDALEKLKTLDWFEANNFGLGDIAYLQARNAPRMMRLKLPLRQREVSKKLQQYQRKLQEMVEKGCVLEEMDWEGFGEVMDGECRVIDCGGGAFSGRRDAKAGKKRWNAEVAVSGRKTSSDSSFTSYLTSDAGSLHGTGGCLGELVVGTEGCLEIVKEGGTVVVREGDREEGSDGEVLKDSIVKDGSQAGEVKAVDAVSAATPNAVVESASDEVCSPATPSTPCDQNPRPNVKQGEWRTQSRSLVVRRRSTKNSGGGSSAVKRPFTKTPEKPASAHKLQVSDDLAVEVISTLTIVDIVWQQLGSSHSTTTFSTMAQDGRLERGVPSVNVVPIHNLNDLEFFPGDFVVPSQQRQTRWQYGVVQKADHAARTCLVRWLRTVPNITQACVWQKKEEMLEEVSVFDLKDHPRFAFRPGVSVTLKVSEERPDQEEIFNQKYDIIDGLCVEGKDVPTGVDKDVKKKPNLELDREVSKWRYAVAGQVFEMRTDGMVLVKWVDGVVSPCIPENLHIVKSEYSSELGDESYGSDASFGINESDDALSSSSSSSSEWSGSDSSGWETEEEMEEVGGCITTKNVTRPQGMSGTHMHMIKASREFLVSTIAKLKDHLQPLKPHFGDNFIINHLLHCTATSMDDSVYLDAPSSPLTPSNTDTSPLCGVSSADFPSSAIPSHTDISPPSTPPTNDVTLPDHPAKAPSQTASQENISENESASVHLLRCEKTVNEVDHTAAATTTTTTSTTTTTTSTTTTTTSTTTTTTPSQKTTTPTTTTTTTFKTLTLKSITPRECDSSSLSTDQLEDLYDCFSIVSRGFNDVIGLLEGVPKVKKACVKVLPVLKCLRVKAGQGGVASRKEFVKARQFYEQNHKKLSESTCEACEAVAKHLLTTSSNQCIQVCDLATYVVILKIVLEQYDQVLRKLNGGVEEEGGWMDGGADGGADGGGVEEETTTTTIKEDDPVLGQFADADDSDSSSSWCSAADQVLNSPLELSKKGFVMLDVVPDGHNFVHNDHKPFNPKLFHSTVNKEMQLLKTCLTDGIFVKGFENRMDLFSAMVTGPTGTPYEGGLFFFDVRLPSDYPSSPPKLHYHSYCSDRLNPNLYEDGKVCVSLLGTWTGKGTEVWNHKHSNLLQVLLSIQGLILNQEPYFNEAGYEKQKGSAQGAEDSRLYNEMALVKLVQSNTRILSSPYPIFQNEINNHFRETSSSLVNRLECWIGGSDESVSPPSFPLVPVSRGFTISLRRALDAFVAGLIEKGFQKPGHTPFAAPRNQANPAPAQKE